MEVVDKAFTLTGSADMTTNIIEILSSVSAQTSRRERRQRLSTLAEKSSVACTVSREILNFLSCETRLVLYEIEDDQMTLSFPKSIEEPFSFDLSQMDRVACFLLDHVVQTTATNDRFLCAICDNQGGETPIYIYDFCESKLHTKTLRGITAAVGGWICADKLFVFNGRSLKDEIWQDMKCLNLITMKTEKCQKLQHPQMFGAYHRTLCVNMTTKSGYERFYCYNKGFVYDPNRQEVVKYALVFPKDVDWSIFRYTGKTKQIVAVQQSYHPCEHNDDIHLTKTSEFHEHDTVLLISRNGRTGLIPESNTIAPKLIRYSSPPVLYQYGRVQAVEQDRVLVAAGDMVHIGQAKWYSVPSREVAFVRSAAPYVFTAEAWDSDAVDSESEETWPEIHARFSDVSLDMGDFKPHVPWSRGLLGSVTGNSPIGLFGETLGVYIYPDLDGNIVLCGVDVDVRDGTAVAELCFNRPAGKFVKTTPLAGFMFV